MLICLEGVSSISMEERNFPQSVNGRGAESRYTICGNVASTRCSNMDGSSRS
jgi:hypothetical protein